MEYPPRSRSLGLSLVLCFLQNIYTDIMIIYTNILDPHLCFYSIVPTVSDRDCRALPIFKICSARIAMGDTR